MQQYFGLDLFAALLVTKKLKQICSRKSLQRHLQRIFLRYTSVMNTSTTELIVSLEYLVWNKCKLNWCYECAATIKLAHDFFFFLSKNCFPESAVIRPNGVLSHYNFQSKMLLHFVGKKRKIAVFFVSNVLLVVYVEKAGK